MFRYLRYISKTLSNKNFVVYSYMMCPHCRLVYAIKENEWIQCVVCKESQKKFRLVGGGNVEII